MQSVYQERVFRHLSRWLLSLGEGQSVHDRDYRTVEPSLIQLVFPIVATSSPVRKGSMRKYPCSLNASASSKMPWNSCTKLTTPARTRHGTRFFFRIHSLRKRSSSSRVQWICIVKAPLAVFLSFERTGSGRPRLKIKRPRHFIWRRQPQMVAHSHRLRLRILQVQHSLCHRRHKTVS